MTKISAVGSLNATPALTTMIEGEQAGGTSEHIELSAVLTLFKADADIVDLTDGGATTLHSHANPKLDDLAAPDDNTDLNATTSAHGLLLKATAPAANELNVVGIGNGETSYTNKDLFNTTDPANLGSVSSGTAVQASRSDHIHAMPSAADVGAVGTGNANWIDLTDGGTTTLHSHSGGGDISGTGIVGQVAEFVTDTKTLQAAKIIGPASNILTITNSAASTLALAITSAKILTLTAVDNYNITFPATLTVAGLEIANVFTSAQKINVNSTTAFFVEQDGVNDNVFVVDTTNARVGIGIASPLNKLHVYGNVAGEVSWRIDNPNTAANASALLDLRNGALGTADRILFFLSGTGYTAITGWTNAGVLTSQSNVTGGMIINAWVGGMHFETGGLGSGNERMTINTNGLVGIGVVAPLAILHTRLTTATTNAIVEVMRTEAISTGTVAAGFGVAHDFYLESATNASYRQAGRIAAYWKTATDASRKAALVLSAYDTAERIGFEIEASGTAAKLSFYGGTNVVRGAALTTQLTSITHTAPGTPDYAIQDLTDSSATATFGFATKDEGNTVLSVILNLQIRVAELEARLGSATGVNLFA